MSSSPRPAALPQTPALLRVGLLIPLQGPAGMFGPSCELCAQLAVQQINDEGGLLGREVGLRVIDAGAPPEIVGDEVDRLLRDGHVEALVGWHTSAVRRAVAPRVDGRVPYVYTALYEGGEVTPGVFMTGETPHLQVLAALQWMARETGVRHWDLVGDDYVWPRQTAATVVAAAATCGIEVHEQVFIRSGAHDHGPALRRLREGDADGVLMLMLGENGVRFNRQFARSHLDEKCVRLSPLMDENMLLGSGAASTRNLFSTAGYFEALTTSGSLDFGARYSRAYGPRAPVLSSMGESCYEGLMLLARIVMGAGSLEVGRLCATASGTSWESPRGEVWVRGQHLQQQIYLAEARGLDLDVIATL